MKVLKRSAVNRVRDGRERQINQKKGQKETGCVVCLDPYSDMLVSVSVSSFSSLTWRQTRTHQMSAHFVLQIGLASGYLLFLFLKYAYVNSALSWLRPSCCSLYFTFLQLNSNTHTGLSAPPHVSVPLLCSTCHVSHFHYNLHIEVLTFFLPRSRSSDSFFSFQSEQIKPVVTRETRKGEHKQWGETLRTFSGTI